MNLKKGCDNLNNGTLSGIKVLDFTNYLAGPYCGMFLADLGADVIKIENPRTGGDRTRNTWRAENERQDGMSLYFSNINRNKRSLCLDMKTDGAKEIFRELVRQADILIENNRPGVMNRLGFGFEDCKRINPRLIYGSISAYGQEGPYSRRPGFDLIAQALGGSMAATGYKNTVPTRSGIPIGDVLGGMNCTIGVLAALHKRSETGEGQHIDVALVDSIVSSLASITVSYLLDGTPAKRLGNRYDVPGPYDSFQAKDTSFIIACGSQEHFNLLAKLIGHPELIEDPRFSTDSARQLSAASDEYPLKAYIEAWASQYTAKECVEMINSVGAPASEIYDYKDVFADVQIAGARQMFKKVQHPLYPDEEITLTANPIKLSANPADIRTIPPKIGEHTDVILREFGFSDAQIRNYHDQNCIK